MFKSVLLIGAVLAVASPVLADTACGTAPIGPAIPAASDLSGKTTDDAHNVVLSSLKSVKAYQASLSSFRECLVTQTSAAKTKAGEAKEDKDKKAAKETIDGLQAAYDKTVDAESQVANDYNTLHAAYCKMGDGLVGCPKAK